MQFEISIIEALQSVASDGLTIFFKVISMLGSWYGFIVVFLVFLFFSRKLALTFGGTFLSGVLFNYILKLLINRPRPFDTNSAVLVLSDAMGQSMPSNHAFCATVLAVFVCYFVFRLSEKKWARWLAGVIAGVMVALVCISRMYLGVHYLTDVLVGVIIGICFSLGGIAIYQRWVRRSNYGI